MAKEVEALTILLAARTAEFEKGMKAAENRLDKMELRSRGVTAKVERDVDRMSRNVKASMDRVGKSFNLSGIAIGGIGLAALSREAIKYSDAWTRAGNSLKIAGVATGQQKTVMDALFGSAQRNAVGIGTLTDLYGKAALSAKTLGASQDDLINFSDGIAVALKASGTSAEAANGALTQLGQALGAGTVRAEEFNSILEGAPAIARAVAAGMSDVGGDIGKLRAKMLAGGISSKEFFDAFLKGKPVIDDMAARALPTVENAMTRINNALTKYVGENSGAQGATKALIGGLNYLADNFDKTADTALQFAAIIAAALVGRSIAGMVASLGTASVAVAGLGRALAALRGGAGLAGVTAALGGLGAAAGPIGAILGIAAAAGLYFYQQSSQAAQGAQRAADAIQNIGPAADGSIDGVKRLTEELRKLSEAQLQLEKNDNAALITQQSKKLAAIADSVPGRGGVGRGKVVPASGLSQDLNIANQRLFNDRDAGALQRYKDALNKLAQKYPEQAAAIAESQKAAELYSKAIERQGEAFKESARRQAEAEAASAKPSAFDSGTNRGLDALAAPGPNGAGSLPALGQAAAAEILNAKKSERDQAIDKQTADLVKAQEKAGVKITDAVRMALREIAKTIIDAQDAQKEGEKAFDASGAGNALDLLKKREGFRANAYYDVNAYRVGYGSDTVTREDGSVAKVTKDTVVSVADALRDLKRRVEEFQNGIRSKIGNDRFNNLSEQQQAALTSVAYNYGSLPNSVASAIKSGSSSEEVAKAIRALGSDNGGVNRGRRAEEAALFAGNATAGQQIVDKQIDFSKDNARDNARQVEDLNADAEASDRRTAAILRGVKAQEYFDAQALRSKFITAEKRKLEDQDIALTDDKIANINREADAYVAAEQRKFDASRKADEAEKKANQSAEGLKDAKQFFAEGATDAFTGIITGANTAKEAIDNLVKSLLEASIKALLLGQGPLAGLFGTAAGGDMSGGLFGKLLGFGGGKAAGGQVNPRHAYMVGENGREPFVPNVGGTIIPAQALTRPQNIVARTPQPANSNVSMRMSIDLSGANGDETIARIARQEAARGAQQAFRASQKDWTTQRKRYDQLKA